MHIGYIYNFEAFPPKGGNHTHVVELIREFLASGCKVSVLDDATLPNTVNFNKSSLSDFFSVIDVLYVRIDSRFTKEWDLLDILMRKEPKLPIVWEINSTANENLAFSWLGGGVVKNEGLGRWLRRWLHATRQKPSIYFEEKYRRKLAKKVDYAICVSQALQNYATQDLKISKVVTLPNGGPLINENELFEKRAKRKSNTFTVFYSGSAIYPWQGINYLTEVINLAKNVDPSLKFVLAINQVVDSLPASDNVEIKIGLTKNEILDEICCSDVCVALPPKWPWAKHGFHGSPTKLFEYMACMTPVITSQHGQMQEIFDDQVDVFLTENDPQKILEKIIFVKNHPEQAKEVGYNGWKRIQSELNWQYVASRTQEIFINLLKR